MSGCRVLVSAALNKIGLMSQADCRSVIRIECYSVSRVALIIVIALVRVPFLALSASLKQCTSVVPLPAREGCGGAEEARTPDPLLAKEVLSQLSYGPLNWNGGAFWTRTRDLSLIRTAL